MNESLQATLVVYKRAWETMRACYLEKVDENAALQKRIVELEQRILAIVDLMAESQNTSGSE